MISLMCLCEFIWPTYKFRIHVYDMKGLILIWYYASEIWRTVYADVQLAFMNVIKRVNEST